MKKVQKRILVLMTIMCLIVFLAPKSIVHADEKKDYVLYIGSYSYSWETVPAQIAGVQEALSDRTVINYEFMDTKNVTYGDDYKEFYEILKYKLAQRPTYDGVIVADDAALKFVQIYQDELFPNTPIAFTGIDNIENAEKAAQNPMICGVEEKVDYFKNIEIAHKLRPQATKIVFINDRKENGVGIQQQLDQAQEYMKDYEVSYIVSSDYTKAELEKKLQEIGDDTIVFMVSLGEGKDHVVYSEDERLDIIESNIHVPVFRVSSTNFPKMLLGGYVVDHQWSAYLAGMMIRDSLNGLAMSTQALVEETPSVYCFNQEVMKKYNIPMAFLPEGTKIVYPIPSFLESHYLQIINGTVFVGMLLLVILIVVMYRNLKTSKSVNLIMDDQKKELRTAVNAKQDFLSRMSHEMRTPLNSILGCTNLAIADYSEHKDISEDLTMIDRSGQFLLNIINDILDVSRIEADKMQLNPIWCHPSEVLQSIDFMMKPIMEEKGIHFECPNDKTTAIDRMEWYVDPKRLEQIVVNLLNNAAKFTPAGGTVIFKVENISTDETYAVDRVTVSDTGCGMSQEFIAQIGEPFIQEQNQYSQNTTGTGLGLYIVKRFVELMGGTLKIESEEGKGSTFSFDLKYEYHIKEDLVVQTKQIASTIDLNGMRVLYAEDNEMNQRVAKKLLEHQGIVVDLVDNGKEAVEEFEKAEPNHYQAILMDIRMPVMGGIAATQAIRQLNRDDAKSIPIIALSADAIVSDVDETLAKGFNDYLTKPIIPNHLYETLGKYWKQDSSQTNK